MSIKSRRVRGFTLLELIVSFAILMIAFMLLLPAWNKMRSTQMCNQAAQAMASDIRRGITESLKGESYVVIDVTTAGYSLGKVPVTSAGNYSWSSWSSGSSVFKQVNFVTDYPRVSFSAGASTRLVIGPKGWPVDNGSEPVGAAAGGVQTTASTKQATDGKGQYYRWTCSAGPGIQTFTVKVYSQGRVNVDSP